MILLGGARPHCAQRTSSEARQRKASPRQGPRGEAEGGACCKEVGAPRRYLLRYRSLIGIRTGRRFRSPRAPKERNVGRGRQQEGLGHRGGIRVSSPTTPNPLVRGFVRFCLAEKSGSPWNILATRLPRGAGSWGEWGALPTVIHPWLSWPTRR